MNNYDQEVYKYKYSRDMKDDSIIQKWADSQKDYRAFYESLGDSNSVPTKHTGKYQVKKSKWKLINWWRKLTDTEKMEEILLYTWSIPKVNTVEQ